MPVQRSFIPRDLAYILIAGAAVRLALWFWFLPLAPHIDDELAHVQLARNLATTGEYAFIPGRPTSLRPPLYPAMLAGVFSVVGLDNFPAVRGFQALLSLATVVLVYRLGRDLYSESIGLWSAGLFCFYPSMLGFNNLMLSEVPYTFFLVGGVLTLVRGLGHRNVFWLAVAGTVLGLGALTRSILFPLSPFLAVYLFLAWRGSPLQRIKVSLAFVLPFAVVLAPWAVRNTQLQKTPVVIDCMGGRNFMTGNYEYTPLYRSWDALSITGEKEWIQVLLDRNRGAKDLTQGKIDQLAGREALRFIRENPSLTLRRDIVKFFDFWGLERELFAASDRGYFGPVNRTVSMALGIAICFYYAFVLYTGAFGAGTNPTADRRFHSLVLFVIAFHAAVHTVVFAHSRYHLPVMSFVAIYSAAAIRGPAMGRQFRQIGFWAAVAFCSLVTAGWVWGLAAGDLEKVRTVLGYA